MTERRRTSSFSPAVHPLCTTFFTHRITQSSLPESNEEYISPISSSSSGSDVDDRPKKISFSPALPPLCTTFAAHRITQSSSGQAQSTVRYDSTISSSSSGSDVGDQSRKAPISTESKANKESIGDLPPNRYGVNVELEKSVSQHGGLPRVVAMKKAKIRSHHPKALPVACPRVVDSSTFSKPTQSTATARLSQDVLSPVNEQCQENILEDPEERMYSRVPAPVPIYAQVKANKTASESSNDLRITRAESQERLDSLLADLESVKEAKEDRCDSQSQPRDAPVLLSSSLNHQRIPSVSSSSGSYQPRISSGSTNGGSYHETNCKTIPSPSFYSDQPAVDSRRSRASPPPFERRLYSRASPSSCERRSPTHLHATSQRLHNSMLELDELLRDLDEARYATVDKRTNNQPKEATLSPPSDFSTGHVSFADQSSAVAVGDSCVPESSSGLDQRDLDTMPGHSYETRTVTVTESVPHGVKSVSSATSELDDLMASLSDFKIQATSRQHTVVEEQESPYARPNKPPPMSADQLDSMLGSLQRDMQSQGAAAAQKGVCAACDQPIAGQAVTAIGKKWHLEHFTCAQCGTELYNRSFFERDERPYCEDDFHKLFSPRCAYCNGPILDKCVTALDQSWHPEHFFCAHCGSPFGDDGFHEKNGKAYCRNDYYTLFAAQCSGCQKPVMQNYITALGGHWHSECFVCKDCRRPFERGSFFEHEGAPYCETHFHTKRGSLCAGCNKPVTGRCVTALSRKYHPEHFVCAFCTKQINKSIFKERNDKPYCHACFEKLFG